MKVGLTWLSTIRGCQLSATEPFWSPQLVFGTVCRSMSRLQRQCLSSAAAWRHTSLGAAFLDCSCRSYCYTWEVTPSLLDTLIVPVTYLRIRLHCLQGKRCYSVTESLQIQWHHHKRSYTGQRSCPPSEHWRTVSSRTECQWLRSEATVWCDPINHIVESRL